MALLVAASTLANHCKRNGPLVEGIDTSWFHAFQITYLFATFPRCLIFRGLEDVTRIIFYTTKYLEYLIFFRGKGLIVNLPKDHGYFDLQPEQLPGHFPQGSWDG